MNELVKELRNELVGKEMSVIDLSNKLMSYGCEDICDFGGIDECIDDGNVVVATDKLGEEHIQVYFTVTAANGEDEKKEASFVKVDYIEEF